MAASPSHKFGQVIGDLLEEIMTPCLQEFCDKRGLFLDKKGSRGSARDGKKVTWDDKFGNSHDLDFVIEKGGSVHERGRPIAFIEAAWRRYTKHSRNKAQEIQGAILPIAEKYHWDKPFLGAVLAGVFTEGSVTQMKSSGFEVMLFPYETIVSAFAHVEIDAAFSESTPDAAFEATVRQIEGLSEDRRGDLKQQLIALNKNLLHSFIQQLEAALDRKIDYILIVALHGNENKFSHVSDALDFIKTHKVENATGAFRKYETIVRYSNGDKIDASFTDKDSAISFLKYISFAE